MLRRITALAGLLSYAALGAVTSVHITERSDVLEGKAFGAAGRYERVIGKVDFAVDPKLAANRIISDIDFAPRNARGLVEFASDLYMLMPKDPSKSNGAVLLEISNRGGKGMLSMFDFARGSHDPRTAEEFGDGMLLEQGYTLVWLGWQFAVPKRPGLLRLYAPVARDGNGPIIGLVRADWVLDKMARSASLADRGHIAYPVLDPNDDSIRLTVRDRPNGERRVIPRSQWRFAREDNGKPVDDPTHVYMEAGFQPAKIYEVVYKAKDPVLVGLGPAAVRDFLSFLKYGGAETALADESRHIKRAIGFGTSQSGRFLRTFLYYGFNADEKNRKVMDGVWAHVAGAGRGSFNHRFAQPSRDAHPLLNFFYPTDIFPFTDLAETDPDTGLTDGLLARAQKSGVVPKIFYTNGSYEYWGRAASLIHTTPDGRRDAPIARDTRIYFITGTQHGPNAQPVRRNTQNISNPSDYRWVMRALLADLNQWLKDGTAPPDSEYPRIARDQLVAPSAVQFPKIPGVEFPTRLHQAWRVDYGPEFRTRGIISIEPPKIGKPFPVLAPQVDRDGNETSGVRMPELRVPLATYTGWNLRDASIGAPDTLFNMVGSMIPFARTKAEREARHDPRPSIEERYAGRDAYLAQVTRAAETLVKARLLLASDVEKIRARAGYRWDELTSTR